MNPAHYHLILNHLPIIVPVIGLLVMIGGHIFQIETVKRTAYFIFIFGACFRGALLHRCMGALL